MEASSPLRLAWEIQERGVAGSSRVCCCNAQRCWKRCTFFKRWGGARRDRADNVDRGCGEKVRINVIGKRNYLRD